MSRGVPCPGNRARRERRDDATRPQKKSIRCPRRRCDQSIIRRRRSYALPRSRTVVVNADRNAPMQAREWQCRWWYLYVCAHMRLGIFLGDFFLGWLVDCWVAVFGDLRGMTLGAVGDEPHFRCDWKPHARLMLEPGAGLLLLGASCRGRADGVGGARPSRLDALARVMVSTVFLGEAWRHLLACICEPLSTSWKGRRKQCGAGRLTMMSDQCGPGRYMKHLRS